MYLRRTSDGRTFRSVGDAVADFRCPGPCDPDCPLYPLMPAHLEPGSTTHVHMCHEAYYDSHVFTVANAIGCKLVHEPFPETNDRTPGRVIIPSDALPSGQDVTVDAAALAREIASAVNRNEIASLRDIVRVLTNPKCASSDPATPDESNGR